MERVTIDEIKNIAEYEVEREAWRPTVLAIKERRRIRVGNHLTFLFENRATVRYQVQEMMRIERIVKPRDIEHELSTYNELIPKEHGLCASLLIEYETPELRAVWLRKLLGLENHIWIEVPGLERVKAGFDTRQISTDRISSVQYISFHLTAAHVAAFGMGVKIVVDHPEYQASTTLNEEQVKELASDFV